jgi:hypothetical protein
MAKAKSRPKNFSDSAKMISSSASTEGSKKKTVKKTIGSCFVLMPFQEPFDIYYKSIIKPAVNSAKLDSLRGDSLFRPSPIMADIWQMIKDAKVLVAELTEKNPNVFYELGLAHAIGKPVVLISETIDDVPFDLQSLRVILYDKNDPSWGSKLKTKLTKAINESMSTPIDSVPQMFRKITKSQAPSESELSSRLSDLERRISLMDHDRRISSRSSRSIGVTSREYDYIKERFLISTSRKEAESAVRLALNDGLSTRRVVDLLSTTQPKNIVKEILIKFGLV